MKKYLVSVVILAAIIRFWQLGAVPVSPDWDEVALGYNAYSILKTGRDEYGTRLPVILRSFDDYKPPLYMYLAIPSIYLFDLTVWSVRLPSAIAGVMTVYGVYLLVLLLLEKTSGLKEKQRNTIALLTSLLLGINPWHIQFSRIAFEANIGLTLTVWSLYAFLRGLTSTRWMIVSAVLAGLSLYAYHSQRVFMPLILIVFAYVFRTQFWKDKKKIFVSVLAGSIVVFPLLLALLTPDSWTRLSGTSSFADQTPLLAKSAQKLLADKESGNRLGILFDNRRIVYAKKLLEGYLSHFSLRWLYITGDNARHHAPGVGLLGWWTLPFFVYGLFEIFKRKDKLRTILFSWFLLAPIAASPTTELPHAIRTLVFLPTFQIFTAFGVWKSTDYILSKKSMLPRLVSAGYAVCILFSVIYYFHMYFVHLNHEFSQFWQYGYKEAIEYTRTHYDAYDKIVVSQKLEQPHMFFLFYLKYDPTQYLRHGGTKSGGFEEVNNAFDKYEFRFINWDAEVHDGSVLYIGTPFEIKSNILEYINNLDGSGVIRIGE